MSRNKATATSPPELRYAITHKRTYDSTKRELTFRSPASLHKTEKEARRELLNVFKNNSAQSLRETFGEAFADTATVSAVYVWANTGDPYPIQPNF